MDTSPLERLRRQHAAGLGVPEDRVELVRLDLDILSRMGTFVRIYAGGLTIFSTRATWAELGGAQQSARQLRYRRPPKDLVPREIQEWFRSAAQRARDGLNAVSVEVAFLHPYRWVGYRDWPTFGAPRQSGRRTAGRGSTRWNSCTWSTRLSAYATCRDRVRVDRSGSRTVVGSPGQRDRPWAWLLQSPPSASAD